MTTRLSSRSPVVTGMMLSALAYALYTCFDTIIKYLSATHSVFQSLSTALAGGLVFLIAFSLLIHRKNLSHEFKVNRWKLHVARGTLLVISQAFFFTGFTHIPLTTFYIILFLVPIMSGVLGSFILKEKFTVALGITLAISFFGTLVALRPWENMHADIAPWALLVFAGTFFSSCGILVLRRMMVTEGLAATAITNVGTMAIVYIIPAYLAYTAPTMGEFLLMMLAGLFYAGATKLLALSLRFAPASYVATGQFLQLIYGAFSGYVFFADKPDMWVYMGGAVVIGANLFLLATQQRKPKAEVLGTPA